MAKRFFNTQLIEEDWYINLSCKHRELLRYCESKCDGAGVFSFNAKIASTYIGEKISQDDLNQLPVKKLDNGKFFIVGFCIFQNGKLSEKSPAHIPIFKSLKENNIDEDTLYNTLYDSLFNRLLDIEIEKEEVKEKVKEKENVEVEEIETPLLKAFNSWVKMRKGMKGGITDHAIELGKSELKKLSEGDEQTAIDIINQSILNSWKGFFPLNKENAKQSIRKGQPDTTAIREWAKSVTNGEDNPFR